MKIEGNILTYAATRLKGFTQEGIERDLGIPSGEAQIALSTLVEKRLIQATGAKRKGFPIYISTA